MLLGQKKAGELGWNSVNVDMGVRRGGAKRAFALPGNWAKKENSLENVKSAI